MAERHSPDSVRQADGIPGPAPLGAREGVSDVACVLAAIVQGLEAREGLRTGHSLRVARLATEIGRLAGLGSDDVHLLGEAARFYDIGTVVIPDRILWKIGPLSPEEMALVRSHPVAGHEMLQGLASLEPHRPFVLKHHERIDGSGYPFGLRGSEIPLPVQVLGLADAYEAIVASRPFRGQKSHAESITTLSEQALAGHWDRSLVALLEKARER